MFTYADTRHSSYRESVLQHLLLGELLREMWLQERMLEVLIPEVDNSGYDIVLECGNVIRHVQLKSSRLDAKTSRVNVHRSLGEKPSGCVVWTLFDPRTLVMSGFRWFGGEPGVALPSLRGFKVTKHTKGDSTGRKSERESHRVVPKGAFEQAETVSELITKLFGPQGTSAAPNSHLTGMMKMRL